LLFQHPGPAEFKLSEGSPLPPAFSAKDLCVGQTHILNVHPIRRINRHPVELDADSAPESISDTNDWLNWNGNFDNPNASKDDCAADDESNIEHNNVIEDLECPKQQDVSAAPNVPELVWPIWKSMRHAEKMLLTVNTVDRTRNNGRKTKYDRMCQ
jgi:hypothetical protein